MRFAALLALLTPVAAATPGWMAAPVATATSISRQALSAGRPTPAAVQPSPPAPGSSQQVNDAEPRALAGKPGVSVPNEANEERLGQMAGPSPLSGAVHDAASTTLLDLVEGIGSVGDADEASPTRVPVGLMVAICVVEFAATLGLLRLLRSN